MKYYVGVTDIDWYNLLSERENEDINFWQPSGKASFKALRPGAPFLFKLKAPINAIAGVGFFSSHSVLPLNIAWNIFGQRNGVESFFSFKEKISGYRNKKNPFALNPKIGCIVLTDPIFFRPSDWIEAPSDWSKSIVQGKGYDDDSPEGATLWRKIEQLLNKYQLFDRPEDTKSQLVREEPETEYARQYLMKVRLGQGAFRVQLTDAYNRRCAISGEKTLPALEAAHIKPFSYSGPHYLSNGLLLRADLHKLYDSGYLTITKDYDVEVSAKIKAEFENGRDYYKYHGSKMVILPKRKTDQPQAEYIEWHNNNIYYG